MPTNEEYKEAAANLKRYNNYVDIIISHTAPKEIIYAMGVSYDPHEEELNGFFDWIAHDVSFEKWYFGHFHKDTEIYSKFRAVYFDLIGV